MSTATARWQEAGRVGKVLKAVGRSPQGPYGKLDEMRASTGMPPHGEELHWHWHPISLSKAAASTYGAWRCLP